MNTTLLCNIQEAGMPESKYILHSVETCFGKRSNQESLKKGLWRNPYNIDDAVNQFNKAKTIGN